jgi:hypothetical protein
VVAFRLRGLYNHPGLDLEVCNYLQRLHVWVVQRSLFLVLTFSDPPRTRDTPFATLSTMETPIHVVPIKDTHAPWDGMTAAQSFMLGFWNLIFVWLKVRPIIQSIFPTVVV